jgi:hypothetical protein
MHCLGWIPPLEIKNKDKKCSLSHRHIFIVEFIEKKYI